MKRIFYILVKSVLKGDDEGFCQFLGELREVKTFEGFDFMSWQKPSDKKCPECGGYMVEKGNKLVCADEHCGYVMDKMDK